MTVEESVIAVHDLVRHYGRTEGLFVSSHRRSGIAALLVAVPAIVCGLLVSSAVCTPTKSF